MVQFMTRSRFWQRWQRFSLRGMAIALVTCLAVLVLGNGVISPATAQTVVNNEFENLPRLNGEATVELVVNGETITLEIKGNEAPITAGNFVDLVSQGFYDGILFHRVVRQPQPFVVQAGDPQSLDPNTPVEMLGTGGYTDPTTGEERTIPLEILPRDADVPLYNTTFRRSGLRSRPILSHVEGAVAMARAQPVDSASSQFYITLAPQPFLDGNYAVFGFVTEGMEVVDSINQGDRIESATVTAGLENLVRSGTAMAPEGMTPDDSAEPDTSTDSGEAIFEVEDIPGTRR